MSFEQTIVNIDNGEGNMNSVIQTFNGKNPIVVWYSDGEEVECAHVQDLNAEDQKKVWAVLAKEKTA